MSNATALTVPAFLTRLGRFAGYADDARRLRATFEAAGYNELRACVCAMIQTLEATASLNKWRKFPAVYGLLCRFLDETNVHKDGAANA